MITAQHMSARVTFQTVYTSCKAIGFPSRRHRVGHSSSIPESESRGLTESPSALAAPHQTRVTFGTVKRWHIVCDPDSIHDGTVLAVEEKRVRDFFFTQIFNHPRDIPDMLESAESRAAETFL